MSTAPTSKRVLISGASIAGPALAYWLHRYGYEVTIVERGATLRPGGYGVDLRGAAVEVAERMGLLEAIRAADTNIQGTYFVGAKGETLAQMSEGAMASSAGDIEIMRDDLMRILFEATEANVRYIWSDTIAELDDLADGVRATFTHHAPETFDIIVGADGLHSGVRSLVFGPEKQFVKPLGCYISIFSIPNYQNLSYRELFHSLPGKTIGMYSARQNTEAKGLFIFNSTPLAYDYHNVGEQKSLVRRQFQGISEWETQTLLSYMDASTDFYFDAVNQISMPTWHKGRTALLGDAAYCPSPLSGQGSSLALVGAYILAGELKAANGDHVRAFEAYEAGLRKFVIQNQKIGEMSAASMIESSGRKIKIRNFMMNLPYVMPLMFGLITKMVAKAANNIELKEY